MNQDLKARCSADVAEVQRESLAAPDIISAEDFTQCFQQWEGHWDPYVQSQVECFQVDQSFTLVRIIHSFIH